MQKGRLVLAVVALGSLGWVNAVEAQNACEIAQKVCAESRTGAHFQLVETIPKPASVSPEWTATVESGRIALKSPFGLSECTWSPVPVDNIYPDGFDITLSVSATSVVANNSVGAGIQLLQGFGANADLGPRNSVDVRAETGQTVSDSVTLHVSPHLPNDFLKEGDRIYIDIGGCDAGTMTYAYEYRAR